VNWAALKTLEGFLSTTGYVDLPQLADKAVFVQKAV